MVVNSHAADVRAQREIGKLLVPTRHRALARFANRLDDLSQLIEAHHARGGRAAGRRSRTQALNRAALVILTGHFEGFALDLFREHWAALYPGSDPEGLIKRLHFNNPWPNDIDGLFALVGCSGITLRAEGRPSASNAEPRLPLAEPAFVRERSRHRVRQVVAEMVAVRNAAVHGGAHVRVRLSDVIAYLSEVVYLAHGMSREL